MASSPITLWQTDRETMETVTDFIFLDSKITVDGDRNHEIKRHLLLVRKVMTNLDSTLKSRDIYFANRSPSSQSYFFSSGHVWMWELDHKESWAWKNWCFWTVVLEKTLVSPLDCKEIKPVNPKGNQSWIFIVRTDAEAETPYFGHLLRRANSLEKALMLAKIEAERTREQQRMRWFNGITDSMDMSLSNWTELNMTKTPVSIREARLEFHQDIQVHHSAGPGSNQVIKLNFF